MDFKKFKIFILVLAIAAGTNIFAATSGYTIVSANGVQTQSSTPAYSTVNPLDIVARPNFYLNKNVKIKAKFDKFSTLGLDYKPAMRSSQDYISFLIQRPDVTDHNIPLSELKIFIKRAEAEKYIELNSGDIVEFSGKVFSNALGDAWMDAEKFTVISTKPKEEK